MTSYNLLKFAVLPVPVELYKGCIFQNYLTKNMMEVTYRVNIPLAINMLVYFLQRCARGYHRINVAGHPFFGQCIPCNCHGHTEDCDPDTGLCLVSKKRRDGSVSQKSPSCNKC